MNNSSAEGTKDWQPIFLHHLNRLYFGKRYLDGKMQDLIELASLHNLQLALTEMWNDVRDQICKMGEIYTLLDQEPADEKCNPITSFIAGEFCLPNTNSSALSKDMDIILYVQLLEHINIISYRMMKMLAPACNKQEVNQLLIECFDESVEDDRLFVMVTDEYLAKK